MESNYYAITFSSTLSDIGDLKYLEFSKEILENAIYIKEFIGIESYRENSGKGVTISYWKTLASIQEWREHLAYFIYNIKICKVKKIYF